MQSCLNKIRFICLKPKSKPYKFYYPITMNDCIDFCDGTEFEFARLGSMVISKKEHMYIGKNKWQYSDDNGDTWFPDKDQKRMIHSFNTKVLSLFIERSIYWNEESKKTHNYDYEYRSIHLSKMFLKLNNKTFMKKIIKESQAFFLENL